MTVKKLGLIVITCGLALSVGVSASAISITQGKTDVKIAVDSVFKDKNIVFQIQQGNLPEAIGVFQAGHNLLINTLVDPVVMNNRCVPETVQAFVSDTSNVTQVYQTRTPYCFMPDSMVALSFPVMFQRVY